MTSTWGSQITIFWALTAMFVGASARAGEWRELFNGRDLDGWTQLGSAKWTVKEGEIHGGQDGDPKRSGVLATKEQFKDFELELEFKIDEHGKYNSGVYLRNEPGKAGRSGYQINIGRPAAEEFIGIYTDRWLAKGDETDLVRKKLDWNKLSILARGGHLKVSLNGVEIIDYTEVSPTPALLQAGVIAFQTYGAENHAGWIRFRKLRVREL